MAVHTHPGTMPGALTPICNQCGISLCFDIGQHEYEEAKPFWDEWICQDCNGGEPKSLLAWIARQRQGETAGKTGDRNSLPKPSDKTSQEASHESLKKSSLIREIDFREHDQTGYSARTRHNAASAQLTAAFAFDFETAGEKLTRRAAGDRYVAIPLSIKPIEAARMLYRALKQHDAHVLNIAGNGMHTLAHYDVNQGEANSYLLVVLAHVTAHWRLDRVISGGQQGVDMAGVIAASTLGIPSTATLPRGFLQRDEHGRDFQTSPEELQRQVQTWRVALLSGLQTAREGAAPTP